MKRTFLIVCAVAALALFPGATLAGGDVAMDGSFVWDREDKDIDGAVRAVFTPTAEGVWNVAFHFEWEDGPHVYAGTATGSLTDGTLEGEVENDNDDRKSTFRFRGTFKDGTFSGTHVVITTEGDERDTGTITLSRG